jgi:hypothetical protein
LRPLRSYVQFKNFGPAANSSNACDYPLQTVESSDLWGNEQGTPLPTRPHSSETRRVTPSGNQEQLLLPIAEHLGCGLCFFMRDEDAEALNELILERRRLIRRLDELNDMLLEVDLRTIEPALRKGSITIH